MRYLSLLFGLSVLVSCDNDPESQEIIAHSVLKCQSVNHGSYSIEHNFQMDNIANDSIPSITVDCEFGKLITSDQTSTVFRNYNRSDGTISVFNNQNLVRYSPTEKIGQIFSVKDFPKVTKHEVTNESIYSPLTNINKFKKAHWQNPQAFIKLKDEKINGQECYHLYSNQPALEENSDLFETLSQETHYWINKEDYVPIKYMMQSNNVFLGDTVPMYEAHTLMSYDLNNGDSEYSDFLTIPSDLEIESYVPPELRKPLSAGKPAPNFNLISLDGQPLKLNDMKGQLILLDFYFQKCKPCVKAFPKIQNIHEEYEGQGLKVIGLDPVDKDADTANTFVQEHGLTYPHALCERTLSKAYNVHAYPTIFLIGKQGEIIYSTTNFNEEDKRNLERIIEYER